MLWQTSLGRVPAELLYYTCEGLSLTDVDALEHACEDGPGDIIGDYFCRRVLKSKTNPLLELVNIRRAKCIEELALSSAFDVNIEDRFGQIPLYIASKMGLVPVFKALLQFRNVNKEANCGQLGTPLFAAVRIQHLGAVELLISERASPRHALGLAVKTECLYLVKLLLGLDSIDINERDKTNSTSLYFAAKFGHTGIAKELLTHRIINTELRERPSLLTPFLVAASRGHTEILTQLLRHVDVDVHASDRDERTALSLAAEGGHIDPVKLLLSEGINPHRVDRHRRNCMHYAVQREHEQILALLLLNGCDSQFRDCAGLSALRLAVRAKNNTMVDMILDAAAVVNYGSVLVIAAEYNNIWAACRALKHVSPNFECNGTTPLLISSKPAFIRFLLAAQGVDPNQTDIIGQTPLMYAVKNGWISVVRSLLSKHKHQLEIDRVDNGGRSALCYAVELGYDSIARLLQDHHYLLLKEQRKNLKRLAPGIPQ